MGHGIGMPFPETVTDADGRFEVKVPSGFKVTACTLDREYCQSKISWNDRNDDASEIVLTRGGRLKGIVSDISTGKPIPNIPVGVTGMNLKLKFGSVGLVHTNNRGEFETSALLPDEYNVTTWSWKTNSEFVPVKALRATIAVGETRPVDIPVPKGILVKGQCVESVSEKPVAHATIRYTVQFNSQAQPHPDFRGFAYTNSKGEFHFYAPAATCTIQLHEAIREPHANSLSKIQLQEGQTPDTVKLTVGPKVAVPKQ